MVPVKADQHDLACLTGTWLSFSSYRLTPVQETASIPARKISSPQKTIKSLARL
jgi:hypothetical protein